MDRRQFLFSTGFLFPKVTGIPIIPTVSSEIDNYSYIKIPNAGHCKYAPYVFTIDSPRIIIKSPIDVTRLVFKYINSEVSIGNQFIRGLRSGYAELEISRDLVHHHNKLWLIKKPRLSPVQLETFKIVKSIDKAGSELEFMRFENITIDCEAFIEIKKKSD